MFRLCIFICLSFLFSTQSFAQCCSQGCTITSPNIFDMQEKEHLGLTVNAKHSLSDRYLSGSKVYSFGAAPLGLKNSSFDYIGMNIAYGISKRFTVEAQGGYFGNKTQNFENGAWIIGNGFSDWEVNLKYNFFNSQNGVFSMIIAPGLKVPLGNYKDFTPQGVKLSRDVQSGTGALAALVEYTCKIKIKPKFSIIVASEFEYCGINPEQYQYGYQLNNKISTKIKVYKGLSFIAMISNDNAANDYFYDYKIQASGYNKITANPALAYEFKNDWSVCAIAEVPLYRRFNSIQFAQQYSFSLSVSKDINLHGKNN